MVPVKPAQCAHCQPPLEGDEPQPHRHQVTEVPPVPPGGFGLRVQAIVALCTGAYPLSKRTPPEVLADLVGLAMSLGTIAHRAQATGQAVAAPVAATQAYIRTHPVAHLDATGWRAGHARAWLWVAVPHAVTVFVVRLSRGGRWQEMGEAWRTQARPLFHWWPQVRDGTLSHAQVPGLDAPAAAPRGAAAQGGPGLWRAHDGRRLSGRTQGL